MANIREIQSRINSVKDTMKIIEKPLVVYKEPNVYTDEIYEIYGDKPRNNGK